MQHVLEKHVLARLSSSAKLVPTCCPDARHKHTHTHTHTHASTAFCTTRLILEMTQVTNLLEHVSMNLRGRAQQAAPLMAQTSPSVEIEELHQSSTSLWNQYAVALVSWQHNNSRSKYLCICNSCVCSLGNRLESLLCNCNGSLAI